VREPAIESVQRPRREVTDAIDRVAEARLHEVLALHFDERHGAPFWLARKRELGFDPRREIGSIAELPKLGPFQRRWQAERPLSDFVPRTLWRDLAPELVVAETGGTSGSPVRTVYSPGEFVDAFGIPFTAVGDRVGFPRGGAWLFVGPSGPHVIGQAARLLARMHDAHEPFAVDLDPRFARALEPDSIGARLYREHVVAQALDLLAREPIDVLFTTPPLVLAIADALPEARRGAIRGIHLGGMAIDETLSRETRRRFPNAVVLPAYGNSLFGIVPAVELDPQHLDYAPLSGRVILDVVVEDGARDGRSWRRASPGETGRVSFSRLDRTTFLPNVLERDLATCVATPPSLRDRGFAATTIRDPRPIEPARATRGLY
jgi:thienamycin biosynthesis protein ThnN